MYYRQTVLHYWHKGWVRWTWEKASVWFFFLISSAKEKKCVGVICHSSALFLLFGSPGALQCGQRRLKSCLSLSVTLKSNYFLFGINRSQLLLYQYNIHQYMIKWVLNCKLQPAQMNNSEWDAALNHCYFIFLFFSDCSLQIPLTILTKMHSWVCLTLSICK